MKFPKGLEWRTQFADEADFQRWYTERLKHLGYIIRVNSIDRKGRRQHRGLADVLVRHPKWEPALWMQLESKNPNGWTPTPEQKIEASFQEIKIVDSWRSVCEALGILYEGAPGLL